MKKSVFILLFIPLLLLACRKNSGSDLPFGTPYCLDGTIKEYEKKAMCDEDLRVDEYKFQGHMVYVFHPGSCGADMPSGVLDENCQQIGSLGGFTGNTTINGEDFGNAQFMRTIWKKD